MESQKICSKPNCQNPASNGNPWCQPCRTEHARKTKETEALLIAVRNWNRGAEAIRYELANRLARSPGSMLEARSVAEWIMEFPVPEYSANGELHPTAGNAA